jgi:hypothetical protein
LRRGRGFDLILKRTSAPCGGYIDEISPRRVAGWAQNAEAPEAPVCLDILADDQLIGQVLANRYRADLKRAGLGSGHHSFEFSLPAGANFTAVSIEVRRSLDGCPLALSPRLRKQFTGAAASDSACERDGASPICRDAISA